MLKALLSIGSLRLVIMFVQLVRTKSLAILLGSEWLGIMAVVDRMLGIAEWEPAYPASNPEDGAAFGNYVFFDRLCK